MSEIRLICKKELSRVMTDRKMLFSVFLLPAIIMVVVMSLMTSLSENMMEDVKSHAPIVYLENAPEGIEDYLKGYYEEIELRTVEDEDQVTEEIRSGDADLWVAFPNDFLEEVESYETGHEIPQIKAYYNPSEEYSQAAYEGVTGGCLEAYRQELLAERVGDMQSLTVFTVNSDNPDMVIQDEQKAGGKALGMMLPYFVTILLFAGAMGIGTDMVAGEKERGTMASMLVAPIKRSSIVLGKVFALMIISGISSIVYVAVMVGFLPQMMSMYGSGGAEPWDGTGCNDGSFTDRHCIFVFGDHRADLCICKRCKGSKQLYHAGLYADPDPGYCDHVYHAESRRLVLCSAGI